MIDSEAARKRRRRRRLMGEGLMSCSLFVPPAVAEGLRTLAIAEAALLRTGEPSVLANALPDLLKRALERIEPGHPALAETTRRVLAAARHELGLAGPGRPLVLGGGNSGSVGAGRPPAAVGADATGDRPSVPEGWRMPEPSGKLPTPRQAMLVRALAWHFRIEVPEPALADRRILSGWIALHVEDWKRDGSPQPPEDVAGPAVTTEP